MKCIRQIPSSPPFPRAFSPPSASLTLPFPAPSSLTLPSHLPLLPRSPSYLPPSLSLTLPSSSSPLSPLTSFPKIIEHWPITIEHTQMNTQTNKLTNTPNASKQMARIQI